MKFETITYTDTKTNEIKGYGVLIRQKGVKNRVLIQDTDAPFFQSEKQAKTAGRQFIENNEL